MFNLRYMVLSITLILFSSYYFHPSPLAWFDSRLNNVYHLEVVDSQGSVYRLDRGFMAPYDVIFSQNRLYYLSDDTILTYTYGAVFNYGLAQAIENANTSDEIEELKLYYGTNRYNEQDIQNFVHFIQIYFGNLNASMYRLNRQVIPLLPIAPHHIYSFPSGELASIRFPIHTVRVRFQEIYYDDSELQILQDRIIQEITIPG